MNTLLRLMAWVFPNLNDGGLKEAADAKVPMGHSARNPQFWITSRECNSALCCWPKELAIPWKWGGSWSLLPSLYSYRNGQDERFGTLGLPQGSFGKTTLRQTLSRLKIFAPMKFYTWEELTLTIPSDPESVTSRRFVREVTSQKALGYILRGFRTCIIPINFRIQHQIGYFLYLSQEMLKVRITVTF